MTDAGCNDWPCPDCGGALTITGVSELRFCTPCNQWITHPVQPPAPGRENAAPGFAVWKIFGFAGRWMWGGAVPGHPFHCLTPHESRTGAVAATWAVRDAIVAKAAIR